MQRTVPPIVLPVAIALITIFFRLGSLPLTGADEPRYARIAQEMHARGNWVTPTLESKPWLEKPPLYYWLTMPFYSIFSSPEAAARIAPAVCAIATALVIFWLGLKLSGRTAGVSASIILLTSIGFLGFGRSASTDMPFACCLTIAMAVLTAAVVQDIGRKVLLAYFFLGLAILGKGPVALILVAGIGLCFWVFSGGEAIRRWRLLPGILIAVATALPWFLLVFKQNGYAFIATFFINHNLARYVTDIHHHSQPVYFYFPVLLALIFPWSGWLLHLLPKTPTQALINRRAWNPAIVLLSCWFLIPIIFFSLSDSKLAGYILPSLPPLALLLGIRLAPAVEGTFRSPWSRASSLLQFILSTIMAIAAPILFNRNYGGRWDLGLLISICIMGPAVLVLLNGLRQETRRAFIFTALQGVILLLAATQFAFPVLATHHSTRDIAKEALNHRVAGEPIATYRFFHHTLHFYTGYQISENLDNQDSLRRFMQSHPSILIVTKAANTQDLFSIEGFSATPLYSQGNLRLIRLCSETSGPEGEKPAGGPPKI